MRVTKVTKELGVKNMRGKNTKSTPESKVEKYFVREVKKLGARTYKFVSPGTNGVPDRIVIWPGGSTTYVELKQTFGRLRPNQILRINQINLQGSIACVVYGMDGVDSFIQEYKKIIDGNKELFTKPNIGLSISDLIYR